MPAGMKPLEKFLKKQSRAGALDKAGGGSAASRRRASLSRVVPFFRETSPDGGQAREVFSPDSEDLPPWPSAAAPVNGSACGDVRSPSLSSDEQSSEASLVVVDGGGGGGGASLPADTPENITLALLDTVTGLRHGHCAETLLDDFMLTHPIFLTADTFQQLLLQQFSVNTGEGPGGEQDDRGGAGPDGEAGPALEGVHKKRAVLSVAFRYLDMYRDFLQEDGDKFPKELYVCALEELSRHPELVDDVVKLQRWTEMFNCPCDEEKESRRKQVRPLFRHFRRIDACLQPREAFRGSDEIFCRVYTRDHSYVTIRSRLSCRVGDILALVREKLQYSDEQPLLPGNLILVAVTSAGEKAVFRPSDEAVFTTLGVNTHLFTCQPCELDSLLPLPEEIHWTPGDSKLHDMSAEEVANQLVAFDWELFSCVHEVEFVCYVFHGEQSRWRPLNLELVLQRCSEVQHWVATEILQCQSLPKRVQLLRKFIKIAALCKQQQDLLSFLAVLLGLDNPALSRLRLTWEALPGKFRKQFQQFESITDPSRNHKSYRDLITSLSPPLIPFTPLLLKDLTFLHESCKTFHSQLVNFDKMHKVADMVRNIRRYRSGQLAMDTETSPSHLQTKAYVRQLQVIDNQNLLFDLSCKLEPRDS
ncbi:rap guanine nucleotide exchange factor-like 1 [Entelurus aequoreus]|uniref:rap guanine nucleotide exchange factor-like 1 n=1 Tax=Entelurus aequoreus TaxID=161455 RepID=UPI002B1DD6BF|nr:rap guanine nucleotide exchange factor-like 1 [Entelurus aequoreus]XP_061892630.1 rap guanine nucleotide exchange factor-like 1 [Entelurus aequoreus]XP_061892631.1 rap guanine nucleotide exchange factor-like 1 [Entelurus aequoreus]XP_061918244.1 rap guanine nucleotide exchange factor-like 1 [Entelurus aequoreus]XP_061918245.1 rap guanine nucleotide exchange factor-like 1 [Entelurus aequoreus]XP_061918247.1 rap guanine nucleotide exchange factor-like 1 [Entelurus aequoreus]